MSFASAEYLPYLALVLALFQFLPARARTLGLVAASYGFYAWWSLPHLALLAASTLLDHQAALGIAASEDPRRRRLWLFLSLGGNLGPLVLFKYSGFLLENLAALGLPVPEAPGWALPLGISFYTFQTLGYTLDVYRRLQPPCRSVVDLAAYVAFFPQLVAGPIERARDLLPQVQAPSLLSPASLSLGLRLILWGLLKKRVLADRASVELFPLFLDPQARSAPSALLLAVGMYVLLYLDFSAYTDLARGSARLFGVQLVRNFDGPFLATSVTDSARRWHMSLFRWIGDHVHAPLSRGRLAAWRLWRANLVTMGIFGLWHGASWTFLLWGLASGAFLSLEHTSRLRRARSGRRPAPAGPGKLLAGWLWAQAVAASMIVLFFAPDLPHALALWGRMVAGGLPADAGAWREVGLLAGALGLGLAVHAVAVRGDLAGLWARLPGVLRLAWFVLLLWAILRWYVPGDRPFVYFQF